MSNARNWSVSAWIPILGPRARAAHIPEPFAYAWIGEESGGNPCAIGRADQHGPDGNYREMGIAQLYNPDDFTRFGIKPSDFRAYCSTDPNHPQDVTRELTDAEAAQQADGTIKKIQQVASEASHYLALAGCHWDPSGVDFWRMAKLVHGLPGLMHGVVTVAHALGHPPTSWKEFRTAIENGVKLDPVTETYRNNPPKRVNFSDIFDNAEHATSTMTGPAVS